MNLLAKKLAGFFLETLQVVVLALSFFIISYLFLFQPHQVKGNSMYPNFHDGDFLLTDKISYRFGLPKRGDVVIFKAPPSEPLCGEQTCEYIKRLVGMPGERIKVFNGYVYINGNKLNETYLPSGLLTYEGNYLANGQEVIIRDGEYMFFGDNRPYSKDSREFGSIKRSEIIGKAWVRYWPVNSAGLVPQINY